MYSIQNEASLTVIEHPVYEITVEETLGLIEDGTLKLSKIVPPANEAEAVNTFYKIKGGVTYTYQV